MIKASFLERGWKSTIWEALFSRNIQEQNWCMSSIPIMLQRIKKGGERGTLRIYHSCDEWHNKRLGKNHIYSFKFILFLNFVLGSQLSGRHYLVIIYKSRIGCMSSIPIMLQRIRREGEGHWEYTILVMNGIIKDWAKIIFTPSSLSYF